MSKSRVVADGPLGQTVLELLGEIPEVGAVVDMADHRFTVVEMDELRIAAVEVLRLTPSPAPAPPEP